MPLPNHSILPVSSLDLPTLADFIHSSKLALTINRLLFKDWPNDAAQKPIYMNAVESAFKNPSIECLKIVEDKSGYIVGYLVFSRKRPPNTEQRTDKESGKGKQDVPAGFVKDVYAAVMSAGITIAREMEGIDHLEVTYIYVKLSSRRQGIGSQLMQVCFERAKAEEGQKLRECLFLFAQSQQPTNSLSRQASEIRDTLIWI